MNPEVTELSIPRTLKSNYTTVISLVHLSHCVALKDVLTVTILKHGPTISKYFKTKVITSICSYISNLDIGAYTY